MSKVDSATGMSEEEKRQKEIQEEAEKYREGPMKERSCTDILCFIIFVAYMVFMVSIGSVGASDGQPFKLVAAWDSSYHPCGQSHNGYDLKDKKYVYFAVPHPDHLNKTTCVKSCPSFSTEEEKNSKYSDGLECNIHADNTTIFEATTASTPDKTMCKEKCSPFSAFSTSTALLGWDVTPSINWQQLFCIYNTKKVFGRICFPGASIFKFVEGLAAGVSSAVNIDKITTYLNDVDKGQNVIYISFAIVFLLGMIYMGFVRLFSGIIVWLIILLFFVLLAILGIYLNRKSVEIQDNIDKNEGIEYENNTKRTKDTYLYVSYVIGGLWIVCLIGLFCMWNNIRLAIAIIKTATVFMVETPMVLIVPPVMAVLNIIWWLLWVLAFVHVYSVGDISKRSNGSIFAKVDHTKEQVYFIWAFIFGGLWVNAFFQALTQFILAHTVALWYFAKPATVHNPVRKSIWNAFRYHLGSLAFGAFILAVVQTIRLMFEYMKRQAALANQDSKIVKCVIKCITCCLWCFERFIKFLNKMAYIQIAISGKNFCTSAKAGMSMVWNNAAKFSLVGGLGAAFIFVGKMFMICTTVFACYFIYNNYEPYKTEMTSTFFPLLIIFVIAWAIATIYLSIYGMSIDTILMCYLYDSEQNKGSEKLVRCPSTLESFFDDHNDEIKKRQEKLEKAKEAAKK